MKDLCLSTEPSVWRLVLDENIRQIKKWGIQDHDPFRWLAFTTEEIGELSQAMVEYTFRDGVPEQVVTEAIQTATLCLKIAEMYRNIVKQEAEVKV